MSDEKPTFYVDYRFSTQAQDEHKAAQKVEDFLPDSTEEISYTIDKVNKGPQVITPIKYEITAEKIHEHEGGETWRLDYAEYFDEEGFKQGRGGFERIFKTMKGWPILIDEQKRKAYLSIQGPKDLILDMIATEFLGVSSIGSMSLNSLFMAVGQALARAGLLDREEPKPTNEEMKNV